MQHYDRTTIKEEPTLETPNNRFGAMLDNMLSRNGITREYLDTYCSDDYEGEYDSEEDGAQNDFFRSAKIQPLYLHPMHSHRTPKRTQPGESG
jgi:hypothetical protein